MLEKKEPRKEKERRDRICNMHHIAVFRSKAEHHNLKQKILKQVEYESARRKKYVNEKNKNQRGTSLNTPFFHIYFFEIPRELKETQGN